MFNAWFMMLQLTDSDQELYRNFPLVISERWQTEVAETVFEAINAEADKHELKKKGKHKHKFDTDEKGNMPLIHCCRRKMGISTYS